LLTKVICNKGFSQIESLNTENESVKAKIEIPETKITTLEKQLVIIQEAIEALQKK